LAYTTLDRLCAVFLYNVLLCFLILVLLTCFICVVMLWDNCKRSFCLVGSCQSFTIFVFSFLYFIANYLITVLNFRENEGKKKLKKLTKNGKAIS